MLKRKYWNIKNGVNKHINFYCVCAHRLLLIQPPKITNKMQSKQFNRSYKLILAHTEHVYEWYWNNRMDMQSNMCSIVTYTRTHTKSRHQSVCVCVWCKSTAQKSTNQFNKLNNSNNKTKIEKKLCAHNLNEAEKMPFQLKIGQCMVCDFPSFALHMGIGTCWFLIVVAWFNFRIYVTAYAMPRNRHSW